VFPWAAFLSRLFSSIFQSLNQAFCAFRGVNHGILQSHLRRHVGIGKAVAELFHFLGRTAFLFSACSNSRL